MRSRLDPVGPMLAVAAMLAAGCGPAETDSPSAADAGREARADVSVPIAQVPPTEYALTTLDGLPSGIDGSGLNVLLVSVDTTRADHVGCYGHPIIKTPNIDRFAKEGTRFKWCISSAPLTLPSHTTMLTGSYPFVHGARDNGVFYVDEGNVTLAEIFKEQGYATNAEVAAFVLAHRYGLNQGFDTYGEVKSRQPKINLHALPAPDPLGEDSAESQIDFTPPEVETDRKADEITDRGIEILSGHAQAGRSFFVFLHYFDPHWPHEAPEPFASEYSEGYYAEIAYFDQQFGRLLDAIDELGLADTTLVVLTSDHGEGRGQHSEYTHSTFLYDSTLHVPLIMRCPGLIPAGLEIKQQVRLVDLAPTITDFAGLERTEQMQGTSLLPLLADPDLKTRLACYSDTLVPQNSLNYSPLRSVRTDDWKYILAPSEELYNVSNDGHELFNIIKPEAERAVAMRQELWDMIADAPPAPGGRGSWREPEADEVRKLAALGYISGKSFRDPALTGGSELDHFEPVGLNPKDRVEVVECWSVGLGAFRAGEYEFGEKVFKRFIELEPDNPFGYSYLARSLARLDRNDEAIEWFTRSLELDPDNFLDHRMLGTLWVMQGELDEAVASYRHALEYSPTDPVARLNLGIILGRQGQLEEAVEHFEAGLAAVPEEPHLHLQRGLVLMRLKQPDEALDAIRAAVNHDPTFDKAQLALAQFLFELGRRSEGLDGLNKAIEAKPQSAQLHHKRAEFYALSGEFELAGEDCAMVLDALPDNATAWQNVGSNLLSRGRYSEAVQHLRKALELEPDLLMAKINLAVALDMAGELEEGLSAYDDLLAQQPRRSVLYTRAANLRLRYGDVAGAILLLRRGAALLPDNIAIANDLAWQLATVSEEDLRNGAQAVKLAEYVNAQKGRESALELDTLAAAYAEVGRFDEAVAAAEQALLIARQGNQADLAGEISQRLELFRQGTPYRDDN